MRKIIITLFFLSILLSSCTVTETLNTTTGYSGSSKADVTVDEFFLSVLEDFSSFSSNSGYSIMDEAMAGLSSRINSSSSSSNVSLLTDGKSKRYVLSFDYSSLTSLIKDLQGAGKTNTILSLSSSSFSFFLSLDNYDELKDVIPFLSDPNFEVYGPEYSNGMSEEEYKEMISFLLGEDSLEALEKSKVTIVINTPGTITKISGAKKSGEKAAIFTFPVIDFLLLNKPIQFSISWK